MPELETVTIEVPVWWAKGIVDGVLKYSTSVRQQCKEAVAPKPSKYELWKLRRSWPLQHVIEEKDHYIPEAAKLIAAAPQILDALIAVWNQTGCISFEKQVKDAVYAALPEDVADDALYFIDGVDMRTVDDD